MVPNGCSTVFLQRTTEATVLPALPPASLTRARLLVGRYSTSMK
jgi:hypothetical protein